MIDMDGLSQSMINMGHRLGDEALKEIGKAYCKY